MEGITMNKAIYAIGENKDGQYWLEEHGIAVTGDLYGSLSRKDLKMFVKAITALQQIKEELPENPKLPLVLKIKELVEKGLKRS
jgi:hypothetical protein